MIIHNRKLKDATLTKVEKRYGTQYRLCLVYEEKDNLGNLHEITLEDVPLPLCDCFTITEQCYEPDILSKTIINVGYGDVPAFKWDTRTKMTDTIVKYAPPKEMTLEEIEEKLGHKVKIVSGEEKS